MTIETIIKQLSDASSALRVLASINRVHRRPYKTYLNLADKLNQIMEELQHG